MQLSFSILLFFLLPLIYQLIDTYSEITINVIVDNI